MREGLAVWLATGFGIGRLAPFAPGTFGSLLGLPLALALHPLPLVGQGVLLVAAFALAAWISGRAERALGSHDPSQIVIDEICGMALALAGHPLDPGWLVAGFVAFRFFDILKPWPIRLLDRRIPGGIGTVLDDAAAGLCANLALVLVRPLL